MNIHFTITLFHYYTTCMNRQFLSLSTKLNHFRTIFTRSTNRDMGLASQKSYSFVTYYLLLYSAAASCTIIMDMCLQIGPLVTNTYSCSFRSMSSSEILLTVALCWFLSSWNPATICSCVRDLTGFVLLLDSAICVLESPDPLAAIVVSIVMMTFHELCFHSWTIILISENSRPTHETGILWPAKKI